MNEDEARRCLDLSKQKFANGETAAALKFANKSLALFETSEAKSWVDGIKRILAVKAKGDLYGILGLQKGCAESDIKKAYRKQLALQFHPDKCGAPGTDDAFKAIGHAFAVLGDPDKRDQYDRYGVDPESRGAAAAARSGGAGFRGFDGNRFESEITPEELFRMFMGGDEFPGFGGPGFRTYSFGAGAGPRFAQQQYRRRQQAHGGDAATASATTVLQIIQFLPILFLILFTLVSLLGSSSVDSYSFSQSREYGDRRVTPTHNVQYFVNRAEFTSHWNTPAGISRLDRAVEAEYYRRVYQACQQEQESKRFHVQQAYGIFGVDKQRLKRAQDMRLPNCDRLDEWKRVEAAAIEERARSEREARDAQIREHAQKQQERQQKQQQKMQQQKQQALKKPVDKDANAARVAR
nr:hypothetical protein HK105_001626 [Polyrhizophydium stewartii]